jgi:ribonuclease BN (tRNA processing enzyme)
MRVTVIGCAGSFPGPDSPASCYLLEAEGFHLVIDMGNGALGVLQRYAELFGVDAICLSHLHADHCVDLGAYWVARQFAPDGARPPIPVYGPRGTAVRVKPELGPGGHPDDGHPGPPRFDFHDLAPSSFGIGPFRVTAEHMNHPVETFRLAQDVDLLLCEASFLDGQDNPPDLHLTARQAAQHAARAGAGQLVLTHLVPWNDREQSQDQASQAFPGPVALATSGLLLGPANPATGGPR